MRREAWRKKRKIMHRYDMSASTYNELYSSEQGKKIERILEMVKIENSDIILDDGCGTGFLFSCIQKSIAVIGLEVSRKLLKIALEHVRKFEIPNVYLIRADADSTPFQKETFTKIFALTLLQNMSDPVLTLREMFQVAKKDAVIVVTAHKKFFHKEKFVNGMTALSLKCQIFDDENLRDYIAVCRKIEKRKNAAL